MESREEEDQAYSPRCSQGAQRAHRQRNIGSLGNKANQSMRTVEQQRQLSSAEMHGETPYRTRRVARTGEEMDAELENPLGVSGGRTVETRAIVGKGLHLRTIRAWRPLPAKREQLANGAQEYGTQHSCLCSAQRPSPL